MKKPLLYILFIFIVQNIYAQQKILQRIYGEASPPFMINMDSSRYLISGWWIATGGQFGYLAQLDSVGNINWCKQYTDLAGNDTRIAGTYKLSNGTYLVNMTTTIGFDGYASSAIFDSQGNFMTARKYKELNDIQLISFYENPDGTIIACGAMSLIAGAIDEPFTAVVAKFDANLNVLWAKKYQYRTIHFLNGIKPTTNGNYIVKGYSYDSTTYDNQLVLYKIDSAGNLIWAKRCGDSSNVTTGFNRVEIGGPLLVEDDGEIISAMMVDWYNNDTDVVMQRMDSMGNETDAHQFGDFGADHIRGLTKAENGNLIFTASLNFIKCDSAFNIIWRKRVTGLTGNGAGPSSLCSSPISDYAAVSNVYVPFNHFSFILIDTTEQLGCEPVFPQSYFEQPVSVGNHDILNDVIVQPMTLVDSLNIFYSQPFFLTDSIYCETATGIQEILNDDMEIYPNPAKDFIKIKNAGNKICYYEITDLLGRSILADDIQPANDLARIDISDLPDGMYFIFIESNNKLHSFKIIKI